jgi:beta-xylosidase
MTMTPTGSPTQVAVWNDTTVPTDRRVDALITEMTLEEKVAQLYGIWVGAATDGGQVAPHQHDMENPIDLDVLLPLGLGQLTRPFGSAPIDPAVGALSLARTQRRIMDASRFGIPAMAHEECLAGFATWGATAYPVPLSWGATFNPELVTRMSGRIGADMKSVGIHQGLAPVLDVVRDARWGRVEETIGEDPYLVATIGTAYVKGLEQAGIVATLKHFIGYSASKAGRNLAPVSIGDRERNDVLLPPFEMAIREGGVRSVMHAYTDIDGVPCAANEDLLTGILRRTWGFEGTVVADYFGIAFLRTLHGIAGTWSEAAIAALTAGIDVELPTVKTFGPELIGAIRHGLLEETIIDRALARVLRQKIDLGLLDPGWSPYPASIGGTNDDDADRSGASIDLDNAGNRAVARELAEQAVVLLSNDGILPLKAPPQITIIGPNADTPFAVLGCYSFPTHVGVQHPDIPLGLTLPTLLESVRAEFPTAKITCLPGTTIDGGETDAITAAVSAARAADIVILALGDRAGLFGRGTSGEGCDAESLELPGAQQLLLDSVIATGAATVVVLLAGRPYALGTAVDRASAIIQTFFPGEEGTRAIAGVLSGRVNPSGRLPVSVPAHPGAQPSTYLASPLARNSEVSNVDPTAAFAFGHGLGYTTFEWTDITSDAEQMSVDGRVTLTLRVSNTGTRAGADIVQLYLHDPVATVVRPVQRLIGYHRLNLHPGQTVDVSVLVPADLTSFSSRAGGRIVEPGEIILGFGHSSSDIPLTQRILLTGDTRPVDHTRELHATFTVTG